MMIRARCSRTLRIAFVAALGATSCAAPDEASRSAQGLDWENEQDAGKPSTESDAGPSDVGGPVRVTLDAIEVELPTSDGGAARIARIAVPEVEVELVDAASSTAARRLRTPVVEVTLPATPARGVVAPIQQLEVPECSPTFPTRVPAPVVIVEIPPMQFGETPTRMRIPVVDVTVQEGVPVTARRVLVPPVDQEIPDESAPNGVRRVQTPAVQIDLADASSSFPRRVLVPVPTEQEEASVRRAPVPVTPISPPCDAEND